MAGYNPEISRRGFLKRLLYGAGGLILGKAGGNLYADETNQKVKRPEVYTITNWTPEKFWNEIIESHKVTIVYWRYDSSKLEDKEKKELGDTFFKDMTNDPDLSKIVDRYVKVLIEKYPPSDIKDILMFPGNLNSTEGNIKRSPTYSVITNKKEWRIRGPPPGNYKEDYNQIKKEISEFIKENRSSF